MWKFFNDSNVMVKELNVIFPALEYKYWKLSTNTANMVLLSANQIADIFLC